MGGVEQVGADPLGLGVGEVPAVVDRVELGLEGGEGVGEPAGVLAVLLGVLLVDRRQLLGHALGHGGRGGQAEPDVLVGVGRVVMAVVGVVVPVFGPVIVLGTVIVVVPVLVRTVVVTVGVLGDRLAGDAFVLVDRPDHGDVRGVLEGPVHEGVVPGAVVDHEVRAADRCRVGRARLVGVRVGGRVGDHGLHCRVVPGHLLGDVGVDARGGHDGRSGGRGALAGTVLRPAGGQDGSSEERGGGDRRGPGWQGGAGQAG